MPPRLQRIGAQPPPQGDSADLSDDATGEDLPMQFGDGEARQRPIGVTGQLASQPFNVDDDAGRKSGLCGLATSTRGARPLSSSSDGNAVTRSLRR
jgi:hypothetical protein